MIRSILVVSLVAAHYMNAAIANVFHYQPDIVMISGTLIGEMHYGPPTFGEDPKNDIKENIAILKLDSAISVIGNANDEINSDSFYDIIKLQVVGYRLDKFREYIEKHVTITGYLYEKITAENFTDVLISVDQITVD